MRDKGAQLLTAGVSDLAAEEFLHGLVAVSSPSRHERAAVALLVEWMTANYYDRAYIDSAGNAIGIIGQGAREIVLLGHIDTFAGKPPVRINGRQLYGRGTVDAKGPLCAFAVAATRATIPDDICLIVVGAVEEEAATSKGARHIATQFHPETCIIGEPSNWDRITLGYKGRLLVEWRWEGPLAHSAGNVPGPAERAIACWERVQTFVDQYNIGRVPLFERLDATVRDLNTWQEGVNGCAVMTLGFRLPIGVSVPSILAAIECDEGESLRPYGGESAFQADKDTALTRAFRRAIRDNGGRPRFVHKTGTADMNVVGPLWNCPIVAYGPGDSALDHTPDEHIDLDEYLRAIDVLTRTLEYL
jgi:LysW-gamma-L-lysine carboxypeptidase